MMGKPLEVRMQEIELEKNALMVKIRALRDRYDELAMKQAGIIARVQKRNLLAVEALSNA